METEKKMWCDFRLLTLAHGWSVIEIKCWSIAVSFSLEATHTSDSSFLLYFDKVLKWWYFLKLSIFSNVFNINSDFVIAINSMILLLKIGTSEYHCAKIPSLVKMWDLHEASNRKWFLCPVLRWNFSSESYVLEVAKVDDKRRVNLPRWNLLNTAKEQSRKTKKLSCTLGSSWCDHQKDSFCFQCLDGEFASSSSWGTYWLRCLWSFRWKTKAPIKKISGKSVYSKGPTIGSLV